MTRVDRVWRSITEAVVAPRPGSGPRLAQFIKYGDWVYPLYFDGDVTRIIPLSGTPFAQVPEQVVVEFDLERKSA